MDYSKGLSPELIARARKIKLRVRRLLKNSFGGVYSSPQRGYGFEFHQLREYGVGDDIRFIDWKSSARCGTFMVKETLHDVSHIVIIALDLSYSVGFGLDVATKFGRAKEAALAIVLAAQESGAQLGLITFADRVVKFFPPCRGSSWASLIIQEIINATLQEGKTDLIACFRHIMLMKGGRFIVFLCSDFISDDFEKDLAVLSRRHELVAVELLSDLELEIPGAGYVSLVDAESGQELFLSVSEKISYALRKRKSALDACFKKYKVGVIQITERSCAVECIVAFFARSMAYK